LLIVLFVFLNKLMMMMMMAIAIHTVYQYDRLKIDNSIIYLTFLLRNTNMMPS